MALATLFLYLAIGAVLALRLRPRQPGAVGAQLGRSALHVALWPLFVVSLDRCDEDVPTEEPALDEADRVRIEQAERSLQAALGSLARSVGTPLGVEAARVSALVSAMRGTGARVAELQAVLRRPENDPRTVAAEVERLRRAPDPAGLAAIAQARLEHLLRLEVLMRTARSELDRALARTGELTARLLVVRYDARSPLAAGARMQELSEAIEEVCAALEEARAA